MDQPLISIDDLDEGQLRDLILQAFARLAIREGRSLLDVVAECHHEVAAETEENQEGLNGG